MYQEWNNNISQKSLFSVHKYKFPVINVYISFILANTVDKYRLLKYTRLRKVNDSSVNT